MAAFRKMTDMSLTDEEKVEDMMPHEPIDRDYPVGLCLTLTDRELEKLDLDDEGVEQGDYVHMMVMAKVRGFNKDQHGCRIDLQVVAMSIEDESREGTEEEEDED